MRLWDLRGSAALEEAGNLALEDLIMAEALPVRKQFDISARSEPQLELRLHLFCRALAVRDGYIVAVQRRRGGMGQHVASIAYELPLPHYRRGGQGARRPAAA